jgi:hypothetical protein
VARRRSSVTPVCGVRSTLAAQAVDMQVTANQEAQVEHGSSSEWPRAGVHVPVVCAGPSSSVVACCNASFLAPCRAAAADRWGPFGWMRAPS